MIKNAYVDPLQESMEIKMYNEKYAAVAPSKYAIGLECAYMHAAQIEQNFNALMEQVGIAELKYYNETGYTVSQGYYIEAEAKKGNIKDGIKAAPGKAKKIIDTIIEKAIDLLKKIKTMLAAAFKKVRDAILDLDVVNQAFVAKYGAQLKDSKAKEVKLNTYAFPGLQADSPGPDFEAALNKIKDNSNSEEAMWTAISKFRSALLPGVNIPAGNGDEFMAAARNALYGEKAETSQSVGAALIFIKNGRKLVSNLNKQYAKADKALDKMIKDVESQKNKNTNDAALESLVKAKISLYKQASSDMQAFCNLRSKALIDRLRYSKAICVKALQGKKVGDENADKTKKVKAAVGRIGESASIEDIFNLQFT